MTVRVEDEAGNHDYDLEMYYFCTCMNRNEFTEIMEERDVLGLEEKMNSRWGILSLGAFETFL